MRNLLLIAISVYVLTAYASETVNGAKKDFAAIKAELSTKLDAVDAKLQELKEQAKTSGSSAKEKTVAQLEETKKELKAELDNAKESSKDNWSSFKKKVSSSIDKLNQKVQKALKD